MDCCFFSEASRPLNKSYYQGRCVSQLADLNWPFSFSSPCLSPSSVFPPFPVPCAYHILEIHPGKRAASLPKALYRRFFSPQTIVHRILFTPENVFYLLYATFLQSLGASAGAREWTYSTALRSVQGKPTRYALSRNQASSCSYEQKPRNVRSLLMEKSQQIRRRPICI